MLNFLCFMTIKQAGILVLNVHVKYFLSRLVKFKDAFAITDEHDGKIISWK